MIKMAGKSARSSKEIDDLIDDTARPPTNLSEPVAEPAHRRAAHYA